MSNLSGDLDWSLDRGWTWIAVVRITPTAQGRRKVIAEFGSRVGGQPAFTVQLDVMDQLSVVLSDRDGNRFVSKPIPPYKFALRDLWLMVEIVCEPFDPDDNARTLRVIVSLDGKRATEELVATGNFGGSIERGAASTGASLLGSDPATFSLFEEISLGRAPLGDREKISLAGYLEQKYHFGSGHG